MREINKIIVHHSFTADHELLSSFDAIKRYHMNNNGMQNIAYHYVIEFVNSKPYVHVGRSLETTGAHCKNQNETSIGICIVGNFDIETQAIEIENKLVDLCDALMRKFQIGIFNIFPHHFFAPYKSCPGHKFDWTRFIINLHIRNTLDISTDENEKILKGA